MASVFAAPVRDALVAPWSATRLADGWLAVGAKREGQGLLAVRADGAGQQESLVLQGSAETERFSALDVVASKGGIAVRAEDRQGKGILWRAPSWEALRGASAEPLRTSLCALEGKLLGVASGETPALQAWAFQGGDPSTLLEIKGGGSSSLYCGTTRAYLLVDDGKSQRLHAVTAEKVIATASLEGKDEDRGLVLSVEQDSLVMARIDVKGKLAIRRWGAASDKLDPWVLVEEKIEDGSALELVLAHPSQSELVALVIGRHTEADDCKNGENFHTVAELLIVDTKAKKLARPRTRLDSWACGAEAGPFGGGASARGFAVAWPRGVASSCAKQGARYGGLAFVDVPLEGAPRTGRSDLSSWDQLDLGCEKERCGAVILARGESGACWDTDDAKNNQPRWVSYP